jgi:hypothetical protein
VSEYIVLSCRPLTVERFSLQTARRRLRVFGMPLVRLIGDKNHSVSDSTLEIIQQIANEMNKSKCEIFYNFFIADGNR